MQILGISGSLRTGSYNTALVRAAGELLQREPLQSANAALVLAPIDALPLYSQDLENNFPASAAALKEKIRAADALIISTPEFNRSIPAALKNVLEWTTRPSGDNVWVGKPVLVLGASSGQLGTAVAQYDLKRILTYLGARVLGQPEFFLGLAAEKFDASGALTDEKTKEFLAKALTAFVAFAAK